MKTATSFEKHKNTFMKAYTSFLYSMIITIASEQTVTYRIGNTITRESYYL